MELAARRYIRKVLLAHVALLLLVLLIVAAAARYLYHTARQQAIDQAKTKQELLAKQTAKGIQNYYESVTNVLELLQPEVSTDAESSTEAPAASEPAPQPTGRAEQRRPFARG